MSQQEPEPTPREGVDDGEGRPEWLQPNFSSAEDQAKAYSESRKEMDRLRSQLDEERGQFASALERIEAVQTQPAPAAGLDPQTNQLLSQFQQAVDGGDAAAQLAITLGLQQQMMDQALDTRFKALEPKMGEQAQADRDIAFQIATDRVEKQYGERWADLKEPVQAWLREHQSWLPTQNSPEAFETVIREAARTIENNNAAEKLAAIESDRAAKISAATSAGSGQGRFPTVTDDKKQAWEEVKGSDVGSYSERMAGNG